MSTDRTENIENASQCNSREEKQELAKKRGLLTMILQCRQQQCQKPRYYLLTEYYNFCMRKKVQRKKHVEIKNPVLQFKIHYSQNDHTYVFFFDKCNIRFGVLSRGCDF